MGYNSLAHTDSPGGWDTGTGWGTLFTNTTGTYNAAGGFESLYYNTTGSDNAAYGAASMVNNADGNYNAAVGYDALDYNTSADDSVAVGYKAGAGTGSYTNQGGTYVGYMAGYSAAASSNYNTLLGYETGYDITTGTNNTILGIQGGAGTGITTGSNNIMIGNDVRYNINRTGSNQLNIGNLIFGTSVGTGSTLGTGNVGIGTQSPASKFSVSGSVSGATSSALTNFISSFINTGGASNSNVMALQGGSNTTAGSALVTFYRPDGTSIGGIMQSGAATVNYGATSDRRIKENFASTTVGLADLMKIGVTDYDFITDPNHTHQTGFIAQDLENIFPNAVTTNGDNGIVPLSATSTPWQVDYGRITPLIVKAVQDIANITGVFKDNLIAWLGNAQNGIGDLFATIGHFQETDTQKLCTTRSDGTKVCVDNDQLASLLDQAAAASATSPSPSTSSPDTDSTDANSTPVIAINGANPAQIYVGDTYADLGATITGPQVDLNLGITVVVDNATSTDGTVHIDTSAPGTHTVLYTVTDPQGKTGSAMRTIIVTPAQNTATASSTDASSTPSLSSDVTATSTTL